MTTGIELINKERQRQINEEGWSKLHDMQHVYGELANAAATYAMEPECREALTKLVYDCELDKIPPTWPWNEKWYKPTPNDRIRELVKAGALIAAEIDRLLAQKNINELTKKVKKPQGMVDKQYDIMLKHLQDQIEKNGVRKDQITS